MKALSLRQPWAWAVVYAGKTIENRRWNTRFRGKFLIHASKGMTRDEHDDARYFCEQVWGPASPLVMPAWDSPLLRRGGIIGSARLTDVRTPTRKSLSMFEQPTGWHMPEQYGFQLEDVKPLPFVPLRGELQFFEVPPAVLEQLGLAVTSI